MYQNYDNVCILNSQEIFRGPCTDMDRVGSDPDECVSPVKRSRPGDFSKRSIPEPILEYRKSVYF